MIRAIIVDDEQAHRNGLKRHVHWSELGYESPLVAENADEALDLAGCNKIDVIITDISMPGMNGIELIIEMKTLFPEISIMIISGYDDFEYARGGIGVGAQTYLLKPLNLNEVELWLEKFREDINIKRKFMQEDNNLRKNLVESIKIAREKFIADLLVESQFDKGYLIKLIKVLDLGEMEYIASIISIDNCENSIGKDIIPLIINSVENSFFDCIELIISKIRSNQLLVVILKRKEFVLNLNEIMNRFQNTVDSIKQEHKLLLKIGVGSLEANWNNFYHTYKNIIRTFNRERYNIDGQVFNLKDIKNDSYSISVDYKEIQDKIVTCISTANTEKIEQLIDLAFDSFEGDREIDLTYVKAFSMKILDEVMRGLEYINVNTEKNNVYLIQCLLDCQTINELKNKLLELVLIFLAKMIENQKNTKSKIIKIAEAYLKEHLEDNITVRELADMVHFNPNYLSVLFKKEVGQTISEYIARIRLEKAKTLLEDPTIKIYEIAEKIGYKTPAYFIYQFKKTVGCTPNEFRERTL